MPDRANEIYQLEIKVRPDDLYPEMGNFDNYTYEEMRLRITEAITELEEIFGIYANDDVTLHKVELNNTFSFPYPFNDIKRPLQFYQRYINRNGAKFNSAVYIHEKNSERILSGEDANILSVSGLSSTANNIVVKIYDKGYETEQTGSTKGGRLTINNPQGGCFVRLEFTLKKGAIPDHFRCIFPKDSSEYNDRERKYSIQELSQQKIEKVFQKLVEDYFEESYEKYARDSYLKIEQLLMSIDFSKRKSGETLVREVLSQEIQSNHTPMILKPSDIDDVVRLNPDLNRYASKIRKALRDSSLFPLHKEISYDVIAHFIYASKGIRGLSSHRQVEVYFGCAPSGAQ